MVLVELQQMLVVAQLFVDLETFVAAVFQIFANSIDSCLGLDLFPRSQLDGSGSGGCDGR